MMFRKLIIASAVLAVSSNVALAAKTANYKGAYKDEPCPTYVYQTGPYIGLSIGPNTSVSGGPASAFKGFTGDLSLGYGALWDQFYLAGELFGQWTGKLKEVTSTSGVSPKNNWSWGVSVLPGYMLTQYVLGYVRLGYIDTNFNNTPGSNSKGGYQVGLGMQTNIYQNWDLRGEYDYMHYRNVSNAVGNVGTDQFLLGLVYKFV